MQIFEQKLIHSPIYRHSKMRLLQGSPSCNYLTKIYSFNIKLRDFWKDFPKSKIVLCNFEQKFIRSSNQIREISEKNSPMDYCWLFFLIFVQGWTKIHLSFKLMLGTRFFRRIYHCCCRISPALSNSIILKLLQCTPV